MPLCQITRIPDMLLSAKLTPANDNYKPTILSMESLEAGSVLAQRGYIRRRRRHHRGLILAAVCCVAALAVFAFGLAR
jgi:hypothetical protein